VTGRVGVIGLGLVGTALCERLRRAGFDLAGYDIDPARFAAVAALGVAPRDAPAAVAADCATVVLSLPDAAAVEAVVGGDRGLMAAAPASTWPGMTSIPLASPP
jgi:3-hydroxyisobutyrate dehydrogenase-like beta-hydroxyacid dehydrogenase